MKCHRISFLFMFASTALLLPFGPAAAARAEQNSGNIIFQLPPAERIRVLEAQVQAAEAKAHLAGVRLEHARRMLTSAHPEFPLREAESGLLLAEARAERALAEALLNQAKREVHNLNQAINEAQNGRAMQGQGKEGPSPAAAGKLKPGQKEKVIALLNEQIELTERLAQETENRSRVGAAATRERLRAEIEVLALKQRRALLSGDREGAKRLLKERLRRLERVGRSIEQQREAGKASLRDSIEAQRAILSLKMELARLE